MSGSFSRASSILARMYDPLGYKECVAATQKCQPTKLLPEELPYIVIQLKPTKFSFCYLAYVLLRYITPKTLVDYLLASFLCLNDVILIDYHVEKPFSLHENS